MVRNDELNDYLNAAKLSVDEAAKLLDVAPSTIYKWLDRRNPPPYAALLVLKAYASGWRSRYPWAGRPAWLRTAISVMGQTIGSTADGIGVWPGPFGSYVRDGMGPKVYILMACEWWLSTAPESIQKPRGRPAFNHPTSEDDSREVKVGRPAFADEAQRMHDLTFENKSHDMKIEEVALNLFGKSIAECAQRERLAVIAEARKYLAK